MAVMLNTVTTNTAFRPYWPAVGQATTAAGLSSEAVRLSSQSAMVASLGGSTATTVYSPSGLLNSLEQAGTVAEPVNLPGQGGHGETSNTAQQALDQGIVSALSTSGAGLYSGTGATGMLSEQASANWAELLKTNPNLASTVISSSVDMGLVSSLSVTA